MVTDSQADRQECNTLHCEIKSLNKGYFHLRILSRPDIQDIYCNILHKYIPLITDQYSMRLKCYS